jgi:hypothetical protein
MVMVGVKPRSSDDERREAPLILGSIALAITFFDIFGKNHIFISYFIVMLCDDDKR